MAYKEGSIVEFDTGTFELKSGKWVPYTAPDLPGKPVEPPGMLDKLGRQAGLTGRYLAEGALGLPTMLADIPSKVAGMAGYDMPSASQGVQSLLSGLPQPQTEMERMIAAPSRALAGAGSTMGLGGLLGSGGQVTQGVGQALRAAPGGQAMGAIGGGLGGQGAAEAGYGPLGQIVGGLAGGIAAPAAGYKAARIPGVSRTAEALSLTPGAPTPTARQTAERMVGKAFQRDVLPEEAAQLAQYGPEARAIDIGGPNVRSLVESAITPPGKAKTVATQYLTQRSKESSRRIVNDLKKITGTSGKIFNSARKYIEESKKEASPYYDSANKELIRIDDELAPLFAANKTFMNEAFKKGAIKAGNDPEWPIGITIPKKLQAGKTVPLAALDYTKRALDDKIGAAVRKGNVDDARILNSQKQQLLTILDERVPDYAMARQIYADKSSMLNAGELGKKILREEPDDMLEFLSTMTKSEKEMFVIGAMKSITDKLKGRKIGSNAAESLATDLIRERVRPAFPNQQSFDAFVDGLERENVFMQSKRILGGSPTQPRQATTGQLAVEATDIMAAPISGTINTVRNFIKEQMQIPEKVRDEIAEILLVDHMASPGTFSNKTIARMRGYKIPKTKLNELANSLIQVQATQEQ